MKLQESNCEHSKPQIKQEINNIKQIEQYTHLQRFTLMKSERTSSLLSKSNSNSFRSDTCQLK